jgi:hypothetical protein
VLSTPPIFESQKWGPMISSNRSFGVLFNSHANRLVHWTGAAVAVLFVCLPLLSQTNQGRISGVVFDQSGGAIPAAMVAVTDVQRGITQKLVTDSAGQYAALGLVPGTYTVRAEAKGFRTVEHPDILVQVGQDIRVDLTLQTGEQTQTLTVTEQIPLVETTDATLGGTLSNQTINSLPLNGRNYVNLLPLRPGIMIYPGGGGFDQSTNGLRVEDNVFLVDGLLDMNPDGGQSVINGTYKAGDSTSILPVDAIQEFNTQENPKAEYGWKPGAHVNIGLKSGTNDIHGTAYAYGRDDALDARNYFNPATLSNGAPNPKTAVTLEQFGATAGGPIVKDKLFWFVGYEGQRYDVGNIQTGAAPVSVSLPNFSGSGCNLLVTGNCTASMVDACLDVGRTNVNPLSAQIAGLPAGSCIPQPSSSTFESLFPFNPGTNPAGPTVFVAPLISHNPADSGVAKIDYHLNEHNTLNGSYFIGNVNGTWDISPDELAPQWETVLLDRVMAGAGTWTWAPNSRWVNELRSGYDYSVGKSFPVDHNVNPAAPWPTGYGINTGVTNPMYFGFPYIQITSLSNFALGSPNPARSFRGPNGEFELVDNVSYLHGNHAFKFGGDILYEVFDDFSFKRSAGRIRFRSIEDFLTGAIKDGTLLTANPKRNSRDLAFATFFQDDWRLTPRLTLNLGLRYEYALSPWTRDHLAGNFVPSLGLVQAGMQVPSQVNPYPRELSPRFGLAWDVRGNGKTVVRVGASIIYDNPPFAEFIDDVPFGADIVTTNPVTGQVTTVPGSQLGALEISYSPSQMTWDTTGPVFPLATNNRVQCGDGVGLDPGPCNTYAVDRNVRTPYVSNWNLDLQQALTHNLTLELAYVGNHATRLLGYTDLNQPPIGAGWFGPSQAAAACRASAPTYTGCSPSSADELAAERFSATFPYLQYINWVSNLDRSNYNALQFTLTQRATHGFSFLVGYTYAHALDDLSYFSAPITQVAPQVDYGNSDYDLRNRFTLSTTYAIPGKKSPGQMLEGWEINSIVTLQGGLPWNPEDFSNDLDGTAEVFDLGPSRWNFSGNPADFRSGPNPIPFFAPSTGATLASFPVACQNAAEANGPLAVASLVNNGCYMKGGSVLAPAAYGSLGTTGRNIFRDSGFRNWDLSVVKSWKVKERLNAQFRAEFFNVLNHPKFANPYGGRTGYLNNDPSSGGTFGCGCVTPDAAAGNPVLGTGGARDIQLGLKLIF